MDRNHCLFDIKKTPLVTRYNIFILFLDNFFLSFLFIKVVNMFSVLYTRYTIGCILCIQLNDPIIKQENSLYDKIL